MPTRLLLLILLLTTVCSAQTPKATPSSKRYVIKLTEPTPTQPVMAYVAEQRFNTIDQLKAFISDLPRGSRVHFDWFGENFGRNTEGSAFYNAAPELRRLCEARGLVWTIRTPPLW